MDMTAKNQTTPNDRRTIEEILQRDATFRYQLLSRLKLDCNYYLGYGNRFPKCLWFGNEELQIELMIELHNSFGEDEKPMWLTMEQIKAYSAQMTNDKNNLKK